MIFVRRYKVVFARSISWLTNGDLEQLERAKTALYDKQKSLNGMTSHLVPRLKRIRPNALITCMNGHNRPCSIYDVAMELLKLQQGNVDS